MITTIGDLLDDIVVWASEPFHPSSDTRANIVRRRGGSAANVASMVARCGSDARFVGQVGDDATGDQLLQDLAADGVELAVRRDGRSGVLVVVVTADGERSFFTDRGACTELDPFDPSWLDDTVALHIPSYSLADAPLSTTARAAAAEASKRGVRVSLDTSSTSIIGRIGIRAFVDLLDDIRPSVVFANRDESRLLGFGPGSPAPGAGCTVVRDGGTRTHLVAPDGTTVTVAVPPVHEVVDTTGAGDAFAAGWLVAVASGAAPRDAVDVAHATAARVLTRAGADLAPEEP